MCRKKIKAQAALLWRRFLRSNFRDPAEVVQVFGCGTSTAYRWWSGDDQPSADVLIMALKGYETEVIQTFGKDAG